MQCPHSFFLIDAIRQFDVTSVKRYDVQIDKKQHTILKKFLRQIFDKFHTKSVVYNNNNNNYHILLSLEWVSAN